jgi:hypothetical protein
MLSLHYVQQRRVLGNDLGAFTWLKHHLPFAAMLADLSTPYCILAVGNTAFADRVRYFIKPLPVEAALHVKNINL